MHGRVLRIFAQALLLLFAATAVGQAPLGGASENRDSTGHPQESSTAGQSATTKSEAGNTRTDEKTQVAAMQSDLQRMRVLVNQMQVNLGFVQNLNTPLRHQFELEIEMWQILIKEMQQRLDNMGRGENSR